jgi:hypothetical protein
MLQQWQYAGRQFGATNDQVEQSIKGVQQSMLDLAMTGQAPEFFGLVDQMVGIDKSKINDVDYVLKQLQKFSQIASAPVASKALASFGVNEAVTAAMRRNAFTEELFKKADIYSERQINQLAKVNVAWGEFFINFDKAVGRLNADHGLKFIQDLTKASREVIKLSESLIKLSNKIQVFDKISKALNQVAGVTEGIGGFIDLVSGFAEDDDEKSKKGKERFKKSAKSYFDYAFDILKNSPQFFLPQKAFQMIDEAFTKDKIEPKIKNEGIGGAVQQQNNVTLQQTFQGNADPETVKKASRDGIGQAFNQFNKSMVN